MNWIDLAHDMDRWRAVVNAVMILGVPQNAGNFLTSWGPVRFSGRTLLHGVINVLRCQVVCRVGGKERERDWTEMKPMLLQGSGFFRNCVWRVAPNCLRAGPMNSPHLFVMSTLLRFKWLRAPVRCQFTDSIEQTSRLLTSNIKLLGNGALETSLKCLWTFSNVHIFTYSGALKKQAIAFETFFFVCVCVWSGK